MRKYKIEQSEEIDDKFYKDSEKLVWSSDEEDLTWKERMKLFWETIKWRIKMMMRYMSSEDSMDEDAIDDEGHGNDTDDEDNDGTDNRKFIRLYQMKEFKRRVNKSIVF